MAKDLYEGAKDFIESPFPTLPRSTEEWAAARKALAEACLAALTDPAKEIKALGRELFNAPSAYEFGKILGEKAPQILVNQAFKKFEKFRAVGRKHYNSGAKRFEKEIASLPPGERVSRVLEQARDVAGKNGWTKNTGLSKKNDRTIYTDKKGNHYSVDTQHGRFEKLDKRGQHRGEVDMDLNPVPGKGPDASGRHNINVK